MAGITTPGQVNFEAFQAARWPGADPVPYWHPAMGRSREAWEKAAAEVLGWAEAEKKKEA